MIAFTMPLAPVAWGRVRRGAYGQAYVPPKTLKFKREAAQIARRHAPPELLKGPLKLTVRFILKPLKRPRRNLPAVRPDLDNYLKGVKDALNGVIWVDDGQVCKVVASKLYDLTGAGPRIEVQIERAEVSECGGWVL